MSDDKDQVNFTVDADAKESAKKRLEHGEFSAKLRQRVHELAYGTEVTERKRLQEKRQEKRQNVRDLTHEIEGLKEERNREEREIERIDSRLDALADDDGEFEGFLQAIESDLHEGYRVDPNHGKVERAAEIGDCKPSDVIEALKERNPEVPDEAFRDAKQTEPAKWNELVHR